MKVGFFQAVYGTCTGVKIFEFLRCQHGVRAFCHLLLLNLLCAVFIGISLYLTWRPQINGSIAEIAGEFGSLHCGENGITPANSPEKSRSFVISGPISVTYIPNDSEVLPENFHQDCFSGVIFSGKHIAFWTKKADGKFDISKVNGSQVVSNINIAPGDLLKNMRQSQGVVFNGEATLTHRGMLWFSKIAVFFGIISIALMNLFEILVYISMFVGVFALMNIGRPSRFKIREMFKLAIYAGFPSMIIGSAAWALQLPLLDFNMIYVLGMTFYLMYVMNRLDRIEQEKNFRNSEDKPL